MMNWNQADYSPWTRSSAHSGGAWVIFNRKVAGWQEMSFSTLYLPLPHIYVHGGWQEIISSTLIDTCPAKAYAHHGRPTWTSPFDRSFLSWTSWSKFWHWEWCKYNLGTWDRPQIWWNAIYWVDLNHGHYDEKSPKRGLDPCSHPSPSTLP